MFIFKQRTDYDVYAQTLQHQIYPEVTPDQPASIPVIPPYNHLNDPTEPICKHSLYFPLRALLSLTPNSYSFHLLAGDKLIGLHSTQHNKIRPKQIYCVSKH